MHTKKVYDSRGFYFREENKKRRTKSYAIVVLIFAQPS